MKLGLGACSGLVVALCLGCGPGDTGHHLMVSREARYLLGQAQNLPSGWIERTDEQRLTEDWVYQRQLAWSLWDFLLASSRPSIAAFNWQTWYSKEDFQRVFRYLYQSLSKEQRARRSPFTESTILAAIEWHDRLQFEGSDWSQQRFEKWLAPYDSELKRRSIPGMDKVLVNRPALIFLLEHYPKLYACWQEPDRSRCPELQFPAGAALLKTAWRRLGSAFILDDFPMDRERWHEHQAAETWIPYHRPPPNLDQGFIIETRAGDRFLLVGIHAMLRFTLDWLWSSLWVSASSSDPWGDDRPIGWQGIWRHYQQCSVYGFHIPLAQVSHPIPLPPALAALAGDIGASNPANWCSNPYLEVGPNNQKTNCVGCHQHAGATWAESEFRRRLIEDLPSLVDRSPPQGSTDGVWSLLGGPDPWAQTISENIEYFDAHDPYEKVGRNRP
jgi:hypothetical protein